MYFLSVHTRPRISKHRLGISLGSLIRSFSNILWPQTPIIDHGNIPHGWCATRVTSSLFGHLVYWLVAPQAVTISLRELMELLRDSM